MSGKTQLSSRLLDMKFMKSDPEVKSQIQSQAQPQDQSIIETPNDTSDSEKKQKGSSAFLEEPDPSAWSVSSSQKTLRQFDESTIGFSDLFTAAGSGGGRRQYKNGKRVEDDGDDVDDATPDFDAIAAKRARETRDASKSKNSKKQKASPASKSKTKRRADSDKNPSKKRKSI